MTIWGAGISAAVGIGSAVYGAQQQKKNADKMIEASKVNPWDVNSPYGNVYFDPGSGQVSYQMFNNPFYNMFAQGGQAALGNAFTAPGSPYYGASPEVVAAMEGLSTGALQQDASDRKVLLDQLAQPEQQRSFNTLQDTLFARGQLGTSGGGIQQEAWQNAANRADLERQLASQDWAASRAQNRFASALQAVGQGQSAQQQNFGIGTGALSGMHSIWANLANTANTGIQAGGGAAGPAVAAGIQYATSPLAAGMGALQNSGALDKFSGWAGNKMAGWFGGYGGGGSGMSDAAVKAAVPLDLNFKWGVS